MKMPGSPRRRARPAYPIYAVSFRARVFSRYLREVRAWSVQRVCWAPLGRRVLSRKVRLLYDI